MKTNRVKYFLREGMKNVSRNKLMSVASVITTFLTLCILGFFLILSINVNTWTEQIARDCQIQVFVDDSCTDEQYAQIGQQIQKISGVTSVEKYTKEQIFSEVEAKLKKKNSENVLAGLENDNPYRDSYKVSLNDLNLTEQISSKISKIQGVANITDFQETAGLIYSISETIKNFSLWVIIVLGVISAFIISNSIKVSVFSRRKEIHIMKYIGATNWFVRWPFLVEGMIVGFYGALIAFGVIWLVYWRLYSSVSIQFLQLVPFNAMAWLLLGSFLIVGIVIGFAGSLISIRKHLKV